MGRSGGALRKQNHRIEGHTRDNLRLESRLWLDLHLVDFRRQLTNALFFVFEKRRGRFLGSSHIALGQQLQRLAALRSAQRGRCRPFLHIVDEPLGERLGRIGLLAERLEDLGACRGTFFRDTQHFLVLTFARIVHQIIITLVR